MFIDHIDSFYIIKKKKKHELSTFLKRWYAVWKSYLISFIYDIWMLDKNHCKEN